MNLREYEDAACAFCGRPIKGGVGIASFAYAADGSYLGACHNKCVISAAEKTPHDWAVWCEFGTEAMKAYRKKGKDA